MRKNRLASGLLLLTSVLCLAGCKNVLRTSEIRELENGLSAVNTR